MFKTVTSGPGITKLVSDLSQNLKVGYLLNSTSYQHAIQSRFQYNY